MPAKACLRAQVFTAPEDSTVEFAPGTLINLWHDVYNCGNETGYIYAWIKEDVTIIATDRQWCDPQTEFYSCALAKKDGWVMPNKTVKIHMIAKHAGPPDYVVTQDYDKVWTLKPSIVTCGQPIKVTDEYGNPIPYAIVYAYQNGSIKADIRVGSDGRGSLTLNTGESYRLKAFKTDYECYVCEKTITACTSEVVLSLRKVPTKCTQDFKVVDYDTGAGIGGANVNVAGVTLVTYANGTCSKPELTVGNSYTAVASKSGYTCDGVCSKIFIACTSTIILKLKKEITYCHQPFKVIDKATGAVIPGVTIKLNEPPLTSCVTNSYGKCSITNLQVGWGLSVTVTKSGYKTGSDSFTACTAERTIRLEKELPTISFYISSEPSGAQIILDGSVIPGGITPIHVYLAEPEYDRPYQICVEKAGYTKTCKSVYLLKDYDVTPVHIILEEIGVCTQEFMVVDQGSIPLEGATVTVGAKTCTTNYRGECSINELVEGNTYTAVASKAGYECYSAGGGIECQKDFVCPEPGIVAVLLWLKEIAEYCNQPILVVDKDDNPLEGVNIVAYQDSLAKSVCLTDVYGKCTLEMLKEGEAYDIEATKEGYDCFDTECKKEGIIACEPEITLKLKIAPKLYIESYSPAKLPNGLYSFADPTPINFNVVNNTPNTKEVKLRIVRKKDSVKVSEKPEVGWKNIGAGKSWADVINFPGFWQTVALTVKNEIFYLELWEEDKTSPTDSVDIIFGAPPDVIEEPVEIPKKLILYSAGAIGCYIIGSVLPEKPGKVVKVITIIPGALAGYEGYKFIKEKIPAWLK